MSKITVFLFLIPISILAQKKSEDFDYSRLQFEFQKEKIDVIKKSKKGEENLSKPLFFWCQGSLPQPVIKYDENGIYQVFPFNENDFLDKFHLIIVGKPGITVIEDVKNLKSNYSVLNDSLQVPKSYSDKNYLDFYVARNNFILKKLAKEKWVSSKILIVAGHSEGSTIAAKMAKTNSKITHLIYSGGNPYGRILNILEEDIYRNKNYNIIKYWKSVVSEKNNIEYNGGDTFKCAYDFSQPSAENLQKLKIPILITFGTKDWSAPFNDLFFVETIRNNQHNFTFIPYQDVEHNYFLVNEKLEPNFELYNWENVGKDWATWIKKNN